MGELIFVSGGVRSGKSDVSEQLVAQFAATRQWYWATAQRTDGEMNERIVRHEARRGQRWQTVEAATCRQFPLEQLTADDVVLLDCLTNLVANEMFGREFRRDVSDIMVVIDAVVKRVRALVVVSNDLFSDVPQFDEWTTHYIKALGQLHQQCVARATRAYAVHYQILTQMKGRKA